jgi:hypothetical protein
MSLREDTELPERRRLGLSPWVDGVMPFHIEVQLMRTLLSFLPVLLLGALVACQSKDSEEASLTGVAQRQVVVQFDRNRDGFLDLLTLNADDAELRIVAALDGLPDGEMVDMTSVLEGDRLDPEIADAILLYLADALDVASGTRLELVDRFGEPFTVTIFE